MSDKSFDNVMKALLFVGSVAGGVVGIVAIVYQTVYAPLACAIVQETQYRKTDDRDIRESIAQMINKQEKLLVKVTRIGAKMGLE